MPGGAPSCLTSRDRGTEVRLRLQTSQPAGPLRVAFARSLRARAPDHSREEQDVEGCDDPKSRCDGVPLSRAGTPPRQCFCTDACDATHRGRTRIIMPNVVQAEKQNRQACNQKDAGCQRERSPMLVVFHDVDRRRASFAVSRGRRADGTSFRLLMPPRSKLNVRQRRLLQHVRHAPEVRVAMAQSEHLHQ